MDKNKEALTKMSAMLLSTTPKMPLEKFIKLCLSTKVDPEISGRSP